MRPYFELRTVRVAEAASPFAAAVSEPARRTAPRRARRGAERKRVRMAVTFRRRRA
jgi:hypothetical protein